MNKYHIKVEPYYGDLQVCGKWTPLYIRLIDDIAMSHHIRKSGTLYHLHKIPNITTCFVNSYMKMATKMY